MNSSAERRHDQRLRSETLRGGLAIAVSRAKNKESPPDHVPIEDSQIAASRSVRYSTLSTPPPPPLNADSPRPPPLVVHPERAGNSVCQGCH